MSGGPYREASVTLVYRPWWRRVLFVVRHPRWWKVNGYVCAMNGFALATCPRLPWWYVLVQTLLLYGLGRYVFGLGAVLDEANRPVEKGEERR